MSSMPQQETMMESPENGYKAQDPFSNRNQNLDFPPLLKRHPDSTGMTREVPPSFPWQLKRRPDVPDKP